MSTRHVSLFLGDPVEDPGERHVLNRLRADLERRGVQARVVAGRQQRQVDLLVVTNYRLVHAEVKNLDPTLRVIGQANGPWRQRLPDGQERPFERNFYRQAHDTTYAISDEMRQLARRGDVPAAAGRFYGDIDTVLCLYPEIPAGSQLDSYRYVDVVGYDELLVRLTKSGPRPGWAAEHWDAFARKLGLYPEPTDTHAERTLLAQLEALADYRRRFTAAHRADLHELVPVPAYAEGSKAARPVEAVTAAVAAQRVVAFTGPSGAGKSHTARHAALAVADAGGLPVWVRCGEYQGGRFSVALARAVAPFTTEECMPLLNRQPRRAARSSSSWTA